MSAEPRRGPKEAEDRVFDSGPEVALDVPEASAAAPRLGTAGPRYRGPRGSKEHSRPRGASRDSVGWNRCNARRQLAGVDDLLTRSDAGVICGGTGVATRRNSPKLLAEAATPVASAHELARCHGVEIPCQVRGPRTEPDNPNFDRSRFHKSMTVHRPLSAERQASADPFL